MARSAAFTVEGTAIGLHQIAAIADDLHALDVQAVYIQVQSGTLRTVLDRGAIPTTSFGRTWPAPAGFTVTSRADIDALRMIRDGGTDAEIYVELGRK